MTRRSYPYFTQGGCLKRLTRLGCAGFLLLAALVFLLQLPFAYHRVRMLRMRRAVDRLEASRVDIPVVRGLQEFRGATHVHSSVSHDSVGTLEQIVEGAKTVGVDFVIMGEHPWDSVLETCRSTLSGVHDDILFIPGIELNTPRGGLLVFGWDDVELSGSDSVAVTARKVREGGGLSFVCHSEGWEDWDFPLDGAELFNLHADMMDEDIKSLIPPILYSVRSYPFMCFQEVYDYPEKRLSRWDRVTRERPFPGFAGNDAHRNVGIQWLVEEDGTVIQRSASGKGGKRSTALWKRWLFGVLARNGEDDVAFELLLDQYANSFSYVSSRILARSLTRVSVMDAMQQGTCYICYEALCNPEGFRYIAKTEKGIHLMGESIPMAEGIDLQVESPVPCEIRLMRDGELLTSTRGRTFAHAVKVPGTYRVECWLTLVGEHRLWLLTNPIYIGLDARSLPKQQDLKGLGYISP